MVNVIKKLLTVSLLALALVLLISSATDSQAAGNETPFGGMHLLTMGSSVCTCSGNSHWILDYRTNSVIKLYYAQGDSKLYPNNNVEGRYQVGTYRKGNAQACSIRVYTSCVDLQNDGTYGSKPGTGTTR
ncbi:MAG: hypothetical protein WC250_00555 [Candidatus Paceibacterota bacterium]|jgi:hypothetical protein